MKYELLDNHIMVEQVKISKTKSGIIIPDMAQNKTMECKVIAVGPGLSTIIDNKLQRNILTVKENDIIVIPKYSAFEYEDEGKKYYIIKENEILIIKHE